MALQTWVKPAERARSSVATEAGPLIDARLDLEVAQPLEGDPVLRVEGLDLGEAALAVGHGQ